MKTFAKKLFPLALSMLFCFIILPQKSVASHIMYFGEGGTQNNSKTCGATIKDEDVVNSKGGGKIVINTFFTCGTWQTNARDSSGDIIDRMQCFCEKDCLDYVKSPQYWDDPVAHGIQTNTQKITLPVVLAWTDVRGFLDDHGDWGQCASSDGSSDCSHSGTHEGSNPHHGDGYGPISYHIQIWDDSATGSNAGIANLNIPDDKKNQVEIGVDGRKTFYAILHKRGDKFGFNSRDDGGECFFNSTDTYHWRVTACCDKNGHQCKDFAPGWWTFTVGTAPEMISPLDPDWNGNKGSADASFKTIREGDNPLEWCAAKLLAEYQNTNKTQYADSYKLLVTSNEKNDFTSKLLNLFSSGGNVIGTLMNAGSLLNLTNQPAATSIQLNHTLALINGDLVYNVLPTPNTNFPAPYENNNVETWFPAQSRGDLAFFSRNHLYSWKLESCSDSNTAKCFGDYGQEWKINTPPETIAPPQAISPKNDPEGKEPVGLPLSISWTIPSGANSFNYKTTISGLEQGKTSWSTIPNNEFDDAKKKLFTLDNAGIKLDTDYKWQVQSCATFDSASDCDASSWSAWFTFRTTGRPPAPDSMEPNISPETKITFPQNFKWEKVPGARSYNFKLFDGATEITAAAKTIKFGPSDSGQPGTQVDYPNIQPPVGINGKPYTWKVQTCADDDGKYCGVWGSQYFKTTRPETPDFKNQNKTNGSLNDVDFNWTGQTKFYWVTINYEKGTINQSDCDLKTIVDKKISTDSCSIANGCIPTDIKGSCVGTYKWTVQPCINQDCSDRDNDKILTGSFFVVAPPSDLTGTFAVCGQTFNNPKTEWDETESCNVKHLFLLVKVVIDFLLFKLSIMLLPILVLITGGFFYLGKEGPNTLKYIKDAWIRVGIGYAILFMAWFLVSWLMIAAGYQGSWWKIL